ncbi:MAG: aminotransferase class V-fold PLP-dependent enzyme, partial [Clostridiales bacterium]|nr:aminotransferase class V-fold PLP-dependent enzyme [Clostridiales bacterium]
MDRIYMDWAASSPLCRDALEAMMPYLTGTWGNASSIHSFGREARRAIEEAREEIASFIGAFPDEICFTSGGTESDNWA